MYTREEGIKRFGSSSNGRLVKAARAAVPESIIESRPVHAPPTIITRFHRPLDTFLADPPISPHSAATGLAWLPNFQFSIRRRRATLPEIFNAVTTASATQFALVPGANLYTPRLRENPG